jgi:hypothetical protein
VEPLSLGSWVGISGAAFTTGLGNVGVGSGTSIGTSLLCGLFNVRLGYWWENQFSPSRRISVDRNFAVQRYLADEFTGRFRMEHRNRWYLSDGGHFENTAAYELIRRRVPFIILCDGGADPGGDFDDLANLIRRVRLDFGAEIAFLNDEELRQLVHTALLGPSVAWRTRSAEQHDDPEPKSVAGKIGTLDDLRPQAEPGRPPRARAQATLAWVNYPNPPDMEGQTVRQREQRSLLLVIKPGVTDDSPADVINYQRAHPDFPHQSTLDQFFDEPQWESYRKLGEQIALRIFEEKSGQGWCPRQMARP